MGSNDTWPAWQTAGLAVSAAALFGGIFLFIRSRLRGTLLALGEVLDERSGTPHGFLANRMRGHSGGREVELHVVPAANNRPPRFHIRVRCPSPVRIRVTRSWPGSGLASRVGLLRDIETGDPEFDSRFVLSASDPERLRGWLDRSGETRMVLGTLFDRGVDELTAAHDMLSATLVAFRSEEVAPDNMRALLADLGRLGGSVENA